MIYWLCILDGLLFGFMIGFIVAKVHSAKVAD
jgi:uncharacterized membrane-anchored protein YhcB (DUF1043 family)